MLSVIDVGSPRTIAELVPALEEAGYRRYWATEHHTAEQSASPAIVAGIAGGLSETLRVGSAAVLLDYASPLKVAEDFRLLELFYPGRVDLGVTSGGGVGGDLRRALLDGRPEPDAASTRRRVTELCRLVRGGEAGPRSATSPSLWLCGMSAGSAALAGELDMAFCYSEHFRRQRDPSADGAGVVARYRDACARPFVSIACYGVCGETAREASELLAMARALGVAPTFAGTPEECREQLLEVAAAYAADELAVYMLAGRKIESYRLLGEAMHGTRSGTSHVFQDPTRAARDRADLGAA